MVSAGNYRNDGEIIMGGWFEFCREMGLGITLAIGIFAAFFFLLKWVLKNSEDMLERMHVREMKA